MSAATQKYVPPVQGRQSEVSATRTRVDPAEVGRYIDLAINFVDGQPDETWTDTFFILGDSYGMTACPCLLPSIVCRSIDDDAHNGARQTTKIMAIFNEKIGANNCVILNVLRRKEELRGTAITQEGSAATAADPSGVQNVPAAADREPEAELPPPQPALIQQVDRTVSSAPSRGSSSPQAYDKFEDDHYSEEQAATRRKVTPDETGW